MKKMVCIVLLLSCFSGLRAQEETKVNYGYNDSVGKYFEVAKNTKLYYEVYGEGEPILMLHGGVYGYINEFEFFINELSKNYQVICLATRGHVKSDIGHEPFTYDQRAKDAKMLLEHLGIKKASVIGFSDGGYAGYKMASIYPNTIEKMVIIGAGDSPKGSGVNYGYSQEKLMKEAGNYFKGRLAAMPEPERWNESLTWLNALYENEVVSKEVFSKIQCPVLIMAGDGDEYLKTEALERTNEMIKESLLEVIPGCGHVVFYCNWEAVWALVEPFFKD